MSDGQRLVPGGVESETDLEHYHRYLSAAELVRGARVLDLACGAGYGSAILGLTAREVVGLDISELAVASAKVNYSAPNVRFETGDCVDPPFADGVFDAIVSFETIEHLTEHDRFLDACRRVLKPGGLLIISTPDRERYNNQLAEPNPHHAKELSEDEFRNLLRSRFKNVQIAGQRVVFGSLILPRGRVDQIDSLSREADAKVTQARAFDRSIYLVAVCSDGAVPKFPAGLYEGGFPPNALSSLLGGIKERDDAARGLMRRLEDERAVSAARADEIARLTSERPAAKAGDSREGLARELAVQTATVASMRARFEWLESEHQRAGEARQASDAEIAALRAEAAAQARATVMLAGDLAGARERLAAAEAERDASVRDAEAIRAAFKVDQSRLEEMIARAASAEAWLDAERRQVARLEARVDGMLHDADRLRDAAASARNEANDRAAALEAAQHELAAALHAAAVADKRRLFEVSALEATRLRQLNELEALRAGTSAVAAARRDMEDRSAPAATVDAVSEAADAPTIDRLRQEIDRLHRQAQGASASFEALEIDLQVAQAERQMAEEQLRRGRFIGRRVTNLAWRQIRRVAVFAAPLDFLVFWKAHGVTRVKTAMNLTHQAYVLRKSRMVDEAFYASRHFDVRVSLADPVRHYLLNGVAEGRDPRPGFSTRGYLAANPDVSAHALNPLVHFVRFGRIENRPMGFAASAAAPAVAPSMAPPPERVEATAPMDAPAEGVDLYSIRPDDVVKGEAARGEEFLKRHKLGDKGHADFASALQALRPTGAIAGTGDTPDVSIIVPVYGQLAYTLNCLDALAQHASRYTFEIIVADDCSPDDSRQYLPSVPWIRFLQQPVNQGFLKTCNMAALQARGRHIVLLNNDTRVVDGWLDELIDSFRTFPNAGLVGSKLFYPDGSLQEAGGVIWQDGSAWNYGRNDDPNRPEYCFARQADYISGAAIAVPTTLWRQLGGFDERYCPAYCEDADLAMRVREAGREVWFQPLSRVIHYEGKSSGTDTSTGVKAYQVTNTKTLYERWKHALASHGVNGSNVPQEVNRFRPKRVLVVDAVTPTPTMDAGSVTTTTTLKIFQSLGYAPTFVPADNFLFFPPHTPALQRQGVRCAYVPFDWNFEDHIKRHGESYDLVLIYRFNVVEKVLPLLRRYAPMAPVAYHNIDVHFLRLERQAALAGDAALAEEARRVKDKELKVLRKVDCTVVHSPDERDILLKEVPDARIVVFPYMTDLVGTKAPFADRHDIMFLGGYGHAPNEDAVLHFVKDIWPDLRRRMPPGARFYAVGANPTEAMKELASEDVIITGGVPDLQPYFDRCRVFVCPLRFGAGVKGKISTSMAHGLPVVSSSIGVEGMYLVDGRDVRVADDPATMISRVMDLYSNEDEWNRFSATGLAFVADNNSFGMGMRKVSDVIEMARTTHSRNRTS